MVPGQFGWVIDKLRTGSQCLPGGAAGAAGGGTGAGGGDPGVAGVAPILSSTSPFSVSCFCNTKTWSLLTRHCFFFWRLRHNVTLAPLIRPIHTARQCQRNGNIAVQKSSRFRFSQRFTHAECAHAHTNTHGQHWWHYAGPRWRWRLLWMGL